MLIKLVWLGYRTVKKLWQYVKPFSSNTGMSRTDRIPISISHVSVLMCDKNDSKMLLWLLMFLGRKCRHCTRSKLSSLHVQQRIRRSRNATSEGWNPSSFLILPLVLGYLTTFIYLLSAFVTLLLVRGVDTDLRLVGHNRVELRGACPSPSS